MLSQDLVLFNAIFGASLFVLSLREMFVRHNNYCDPLRGMIRSLLTAMHDDAKPPPPPDQRRADQCRTTFLIQAYRYHVVLNKIPTLLTGNMHSGHEGATHPAHSTLSDFTHPIDVVSAVTHHAQPVRSNEPKQAVTQTCIRTQGLQSFAQATLVDLALI